MDRLRKPLIVIFILLMGVFYAGLALYALGGITSIGGALIACALVAVAYVICAALLLSLWWKG